jgi:endonuclease YncB( thermonuclease family)
VLGVPLEKGSVTAMSALRYNAAMKILHCFRILSRLTVLILCTVLTGNLAWAGGTGEVVAISSGDTITILNASNKQQLIRLAEIDAPERGQPYFEKAKQALVDKVLKKTISFERTAWDTKGQLVAKVTLNGEYLNAWLVAEGHVWVYRAYSDDPQMLELEAGAQKKKLGLWTLPPPDRVPPWEWIPSPAGRDSE